MYDVIKIPLSDWPELKTSIIQVTYNIGLNFSTYKGFVNSINSPRAFKITYDVIKMILSDWTSPIIVLVVISSI